MYSACIAFLVSLVFTYVVIKFAHRYGIVDNPTGGRKIHKQPTALLGGVSIIITFVLVLSATFHLGYPFPHFNSTAFFAFLGASLVLLIAGVYDDIHDLSPRWQLSALLFAAGIFATATASPLTVSNPFGGVIIFSTLSSALLVFGWITTVTLTTKLLDGLDGLVGGLVTIGALLIAIFSLTTAYFQPDVAVIAMILVGSTLGFVWFNYHPARIFLGNSGSMWLGFALAVIALIGGGKFAVATLVFAVPFVDMGYVMVHRLLQGKKPWEGDNTHLHFRLRERFGTVKTVWIYYGIALFSGCFTLFLTSGQKYLFLILLLTSILIFILKFKEKSPQ